MLVEIMIIFFSRVWREDGFGEAKGPGPECRELPDRSSIGRARRGVLFRGWLRAGLEFPSGCPDLCTPFLCVRRRLSKQDLRRHGQMPGPGEGRDGSGS